MFSQIRLQLADTHLAGIDLRFGGGGLVSTILDGTELGVVLVQLSDANVFGRHPEGERAREFALDGIEVIALGVRQPKRTNDLLLLRPNLLLLAVGGDLAFDGFQIFTIGIREGLFDSLDDVDAN